MANSLNNRPHYLEIRERMKKDPNNYLWDKLKWNDEDLSFYNKGKTIEVKKRKVKSGLKVMRVSDGKIYDSVKLCRDDNGFYSDQMIDKLNNGIEFKRL